MLQSNIQKIFLNPTKHSNVWTVELRLPFETRYVGKLDKAGEGTFLCKRKEKHLHRKTNSLGVNLELLQRFDFRWVCIEYCGRKLFTTKLYLLHNGKVFTFDKSGFESQVFLELDAWGQEKAVEFERQLCSQVNLFEVAA
ncbi:MAG: hypothetical protein ABSC53_07210 [Bacteroidota bacterium]